MNFIRRIRAERKAKRGDEKSKRDAERLALYRDWPPNLVDRFLDWENAPLSRRTTMNYSTAKMYTAWKLGEDYATYDPEKAHVIIGWNQ